MAQVLYRWLKDQDPDCIIDVMAPPHTGALIARMPEVRKFIPLAIGHGEWKLPVRYRVAKSLRHEKYDQAIVIPNSWKSALVPFLAGIPIRTGWRGEMRYGLLNDVRTLDKKALPLMIQRCAGLGMPKDQRVPGREQLPRPLLVASESAQKAVLAKHNLNTDKPILVLCPGAEFGAAKRWPPEHFAMVARQKLQEGWQVWLLGSPKESDAAATIQRLTEHTCVNLVGQTDLSQAIDLLSLANAVVSNDSGLMHIAAALNKPVVVMYGSSSSEFTPPLGDYVAILSLRLSCSPCFKRECKFNHLRCLVDLKPEMVLNALRALPH
jgi:heptosyltransferase-2